jgi:long-subunit fatty acid transport protein
MKKIIALIFISGLGYAQSIGIADGFRFANDRPIGTSRFNALGGAMGAVGGDMSAFSINPAGSSIFNTNQASLSLSVGENRNYANYFGTNTLTTDTDLDFNQAGAVLVFEDKSGKSKWNKFAIGLNYEVTNNFNNAYSISGVNPYNSIDNYFLRYANGIGNEGVFVISLVDEPFDSLGFLDQQAWLGYNGFIVEYDADINKYYTNVPLGGNYNHVKNIVTEGGTSKLVANFSMARDNKFYVGANLNFHFVDYLQSFSLFESNNNPLYDTGFSILDTRFNTDLFTYGSGFSMNLGFIYKVNQTLRIGASYESPTWYKLNDELTQSVYSTVSEANAGTSFEGADPNTTILYEPYRLQTPSKFTSSAAITLNKKWLISVDYSTRDFSNIKFRPEADYSDLNQGFKELLTDNYELRLGTEYKIKQWSLRGGYRHEKSPAVLNQAFGDQTAYSGGFGYSFGDSRVDFSMISNSFKRNEAILPAGLTDLSRIRNRNNTFTLSYVVNF